MSGIIDWLDERAGIRRLWSKIADEEVPGGARLRYVFGSVLTYLFMQQVVLGILLATYYSPSATDAWASVAYLNDQVPGGWFLRGLHHHGSSAMVVLLVLHLLQVTWAGAYRRPRELNWWTGLAMAGLVFGLALTGYLLPWDQKGYWATQVATGIVGTIPGGEPIRVLLQGGTEYGNLTLTRFYALHVFVLPSLLVMLLVSHIALFRRHGVTPPASKTPQQLAATKARFIPHQLFYDVLGMAVTATVLVVLTTKTHGAELFAPAQPASNFVARPEWYFLFLFQLLKYFEGPASLVATVVIPGVVVGSLVALPWIDRAQSRRARHRIPALGLVAAVMSGIIALTAIAVLEDREDELFQKGLAAAQTQAEAARHWAHEGVLPAGGDAVFANDPQIATKLMFAEHCSTCHRIGRVGGNEAPNLTNYNSRAWIAALIRNPNEERFFGNTVHKLMEPSPPADMSQDQLLAIVEYVTSLMGEVGGPVDPALSKRGRELFNETFDCSLCHEVEPGETSDGPTLHGRGSPTWIARVIRDSSAEDLFGENAQMPKFGQKLSEQDIERLAAFVAALRAEPADTPNSTPSP